MHRDGAAALAGSILVALGGAGCAGSSASRATPPVAPPASATAAPLYPPMPLDPVTSALAVRVRGDALVDSTGSPLRLHGVNVSGTEFACDQGTAASGRGWSIYGDQPLDQPATYTAMQRWHVRVVRVPLNEDCWLGVNGVAAAYAGARYAAAIEREVGLVHAAGMVAVLDLHWSAPGPWPAIAQQPMPDADHSVAFWSSVASAFRADPAVVFDLFNEPFIYGSYLADGAEDPWSCWLRGCELSQIVSGGHGLSPGTSAGYTTAYRWRAAGMQELIDAVRGAGASQPVVVNGLDWSNDLSGWLRARPADPAGELVAGWHSYPGERCDTPACWDASIAPVAAEVPVLVGETGDSDCTPARFIAGFLSWADGHRLSYLGWTWNPWRDCANVLIRSWDGTPASGYGALFLEHLGGI